MRKIGYMRVSTGEQRPDRQIDGLKEICDEYFVETLSAVSRKRPIYQKVIRSLKPGDMLVVWDLDRAFRSAKDALNELDLLQKRGVEFRIASLKIDTTTPEGYFVYTIMGAVAEFERRNLATDQARACGRAPPGRAPRPAAQADAGGAVRSPLPDRGRNRYHRRNRRRARHGGMVGDARHQPFATDVAALGVQWRGFRQVAEFSWLVRWIDVQWKVRRLTMTQDTARSARLEARIAPEALAIVRRAAELEGRSLSDFVVAAAQEVAQRTIEQNNVIRLSVEDQQRFVDMLLNPPEPAAALKRAKAAHDELILQSR